MMSLSVAAIHMGTTTIFLDILAALFGWLRSG